ncbi:hypothetical protein D3C80_217970 [compost metagenome]
MDRQSRLPVGRFCRDERRNGFDGGAPEAFSGLSGQTLCLAGQRRRLCRHDPAQPAGAQESTDLRKLCRAARPLSRSGLRVRYPCHRPDGCRRKLLFRRRCLRNHRAVDENADARASGLHPHDRRSGQGNEEMPAADRRCRRWHLRRCRRDPRHGLRLEACNAGSENRLPLHPCRPRRCRYGRLRDPAAYHRPGPRRRASLHRPFDDRR